MMEGTTQTARPTTKAAGTAIAHPNHQTSRAIDFPAYTAPHI
jgi:hypothetical protein